MPDVIKKHFTWLIAIGFSALNFLLSLRYVGFVMFDEDPWIAIYGAKRILEGQLLYRNFFDFVTPGTDYLLAGIFSVFGTKLTVAQFAVVLSNAAVTAIVVFMSFDIIKNKWLRLLPGLLFSLYSAYVYYVSHHWFILLPVILVLFTGIQIVTSGTAKPHKWLFSGLATAGAFLFIQSIGVTLLSMLVLFIIWYYTGSHILPAGAGRNSNGHPDSNVIPAKAGIQRFFAILRMTTGHWIEHQVRNDRNDSKKKSSPNKSYGRGILLRSVIYYISGFLIPIIFVVIMFALSGSLSAFIYDSFIWPFSHYRAINLSTPSDLLRLWIKELSSNGFIMGIIYSFVAYFGILLSLMAFGYTAFKVRKDKTRELSLVAFVSFFCIGIVAGLLPNPPAFHLMVFLSVYMLAIIVIFEYAPFWSSRLIRAGFYFWRIRLLNGYIQDIVVYV